MIFLQCRRIDELDMMKLTHEDFNIQKIEPQRYNFPTNKCRRICFFFNALNYKKGKFRKRILINFSYLSEEESLNCKLDIVMFHFNSAVTGSYYMKHGLGRSFGYLAISEIIHVFFN